MSTRPAPTAIDLAQTSPARLMFALLHRRFTGTLQLDQPSLPAEETATRSVWFVGGMPVYTDWTHPPDVLGQVLLDQKLVDAATLDQALDRCSREGGLLGEILVQQGTITAAQRDAALKLQCARKLVHLLGLRSGVAYLNRQAHDLQQMEAVNVLQLLLVAVGRHYDETRVRDEMGALLDGPLRITGALARYRDHFRFRATDHPTLTALQSSTTYAALAAEASPGAARVVQLIYVLWTCQMLYTGDAAQQAPGRPTPPASTRPADRADPPASTSRGRQRPARSPAPAEQSATEQPAAEVQAAPPSEAAFLAELESFEQRIHNDANPFALLGLGHDAGRKDIRSRWAELSRFLHPDALQAKGWNHLHGRVSAVFAALSEANTVLSNKQERARLAEALAQGEDPTAAAGSATADSLARAALESEVVARDGDRYLKANRFELAAAQYREALALNPDEPDYKAAALWCEYNLSNRSRAAASKAERALAGLMEEAPRLARAALWRGHVLRDLGDNEAAIICYQRAHRADNRLIEAQRFIRALTAAKGKTDSVGKNERKRGRGLKGLFTKG